MSMNCLTTTLASGSTLRWQWQGPFEKYARSYLKRHWWRIRAYFGEFEDAVQEAAFIWCRVLRRVERQSHRPRVDNNAWLMALYKVTLSNEVNRWSWRDTHTRHVVFDASMGDGEDEQGRPTSPSDCIDPSKLVIAALDMSPALARVIRFLGDAPSVVLDRIFTVGVAYSNQTNDILDRRLKRCAGVQGHAANVLEELQELLAA